MRRHSNWSSCFQLQRENLPFDRCWTTRLERCAQMPSSPSALPNLSQGKFFFGISGRGKKPSYIYRENYDLSFNFRLLQLCPFLPLHYFFAVGKYFSGEIQFLLLPTWALPEWPWHCNHYTCVAVLQMTCLAGLSNWQLNMAGYEELQQRRHGKKQHEKQKWCIHLFPNSVCLLLLYLLSNSFPSLIMFLWQSFLSAASLQSANGPFSSRMSVFSASHLTVD